MKHDACFFLEKPHFARKEDQPGNKNAISGDTVIFKCAATATPEASVTWFINSEPLNGNDMLILCKQYFL